MEKNIGAIETINDIDYSVPNFRIEDMESDAFILFCGKRGTRGTTTAISLLKNYVSRRGVVFCNSVEKNRYESIFNNILNLMRSMILLLLMIFYRVVIGILYTDVQIN
jgi:hypothetical protein